MDNGGFSTINHMMKITNCEGETADMNTYMAWTLDKEKYDTKIETCISPNLTR